MKAEKLDKLLIKDLLVRCIIGIKPEERKNKQDVSINITLLGDLVKACRSDEINDTINYADIKKKVYAHVEKSSYNLIEAMAENVAKICFEEEKVREVIVAIEKPGALRFAKTVGIEIHRIKNKS